MTVLTKPRKAKAHTIPTIEFPPPILITKIEKKRRIMDADYEADKESPLAPSPEEKGFLKKVYFLTLAEDKKKV